MKESVKNIFIILLSAIWLGIFIYVGTCFNYSYGLYILLAWLLIFVLYMVLEYVCVKKFKCPKLPYIAFTIIFAFPVLMFISPFFCMMMNYSDKDVVNNFIGKAILLYAIFIPTRVMIIPIELLVKKLKGARR